MCGFAGFSVSHNSENNTAIIKKMNDKLQHRGPDGEGFFFNNLISLAHKRLSIIDLNERSNQPFTDNQKKHIIVFNGEIYNYLELKNELLKKDCIFSTESDTEVLLKAYIYWGKNFLNKIRGMFSFVIYDIEKNILFCARDHFGQKPFFYYFDNKDFIFSSELRSLLQHPLIPKTICKKSIMSYLHYDSFVGETTPIDNCYKLLPSEYLIFNISNKTIQKKKYWDINIHSEKKKNENSENIFFQKLNNSVKIHLRSDVPIALYLSGGLDSSTLAHITKKTLAHNNISAFNLRFKESSFNEDIDARSTANKLNLKLNTFEIQDLDYISSIKKSIDDLDEPLGDLGYMAIYLISNFVSKEGYKVAISGDGGDELLMGYEPFQKYGLFKLLNSSTICSSLVKKISSFLKDDFNYMGLNHKIKIFSKALTYKNDHANTRWISAYMPEEIKDLFIEDQNNFKNLETDNIYNYINSVNQSIKSDDDYDKLLAQYQKHFLTNLICSHTDKANMAHSIEARSPFLDHELFDYVNSLPKNFKRNKNFSKLPLRNYLKKNLDNDVYKNPKKGFTVPMAKWIQSEIKEMVLDILSQKNISRLNFINYDYLKKVVLEPHLKNKQNNHKKIWNIFVLVNWLNNNVY
jgi:asparagine synthase (glutamine-hydrolysing)